MTPWVKGQSGNPLGASKVQREFAKAVRDRSQDGKQLLDFLFATMRDADAHPVARFKSCELLIRYGYGDPRPQEDGDGLAIDATKLNDTEREQLIGLLSKLGLQGERPAAHPEAPPATAAAS